MKKLALVLLIIGSIVSISRAAERTPKEVLRALDREEEQAEDRFNERPTKDNFQAYVYAQRQLEDAYLHFSHALKDATDKESQQQYMRYRDKREYYDGFARGMKKAEQMLAKEMKSEHEKMRNELKSAHARIKELEAALAGTPPPIPAWSE